LVLIARALVVTLNFSPFTSVNSHYQVSQFCRNPSHFSPENGIGGKNPDQPEHSPPGANQTSVDDRTLVAICLTVMVSRQAAGDCRFFHYY
jgi:hypothetical protein